MKALVYRGPLDIRCESVDAPRIVADDDLIVKTSRCAICGSDLHIYHGHMGQERGFCVGHEAVGEVVETGKGVRRFKAGDIVMLSAAVGCGRCRRCLAGDPVRCETHAQLQCYGLGSALQGCQAEAVRVPHGDFNVAPIPEGLSLDQALMLTDNLPTAYFGCLNAEIGAGDVVVVIGLGPIGLMAVECAFVLGASRVFALDLVPQRRALAEQLGAVALDPAAAEATIREATRGRMADCAVEAVGAEATINAAIGLVGKGGRVSVVGVNTAMNFPFPMGLALSNGLTFRIGVCSVQNHWPDLVPLIQQGRLHPERFITHEFALAQGGEAYRQFDARVDGVLKTVLVP